MAGESEALAAELKARKESRDCDLGKDADVSEKRRKLEQEIKEAEKQLETMLSPNGRKALAKDLYEMRQELRAMGSKDAAQDAGEKRKDFTYEAWQVASGWAVRRSDGKQAVVQGAKSKEEAIEEAAKAW